MAGDTLYCPKYGQHLNAMHAEKNKAKTDKEKLKILSKVASKFTMLPEELNEFASVCQRCNKNFKYDNYFCFYSSAYSDTNAKHIEWSNKYHIIAKLQDQTCKNRFQLVEEALTFPHRWLDDLRERCLYFSVSPLPPKIVKQFHISRRIYREIINFENDNDINKWLKCIKEIENKEAVVANFELKLGQDNNWKNKKLWKFYFNFLKENNMIEILEVFQKYTRLFICDKQAVSHYRNKLDKFSSWNFPTTKYWIDTIKFEIEFGKFSSAYRILGRALKAVIGKPYHFVVQHKNDLCNKLNIFETEMVKVEELRYSAKISNCPIEISSPVVYYRNPQQQQQFCFHQSFIHNLYKNAEGRILRKLYSTCKFFHSMRKAPLCYRLEICKDKKTSYSQESLYLNEMDINFLGLNNLHVYEMLNVEVCVNPDLVSQMIAKLKYCTVKHMFIREQNLTVSEFQMLLSNHLFQIFCTDVEIKCNGQINDVKCFLDMVNNYPDIEYIDFVTSKLFICRATEIPNRVLHWLPFSNTMQLETMYLEYQTCSTMSLKQFINYEMLKNVTLKNVTIKDENATEMDKQRIQEFIKAEVNPKNNVCIEMI